MPVAELDQAANEQESEGVRAWLLQITQGIEVALAQFEVVHIVDKPASYEIPQAPAYCKHVVIWNNRIIPVVNLMAWMTGEAQPAEDIIAVINYQDEHGDYHYGGLGLANIPVLTHVRDAMHCKLPENEGKWDKIAVSCFKTEFGQKVPILDALMLFSSHLQRFSQGAAS